MFSIGKALVKENQQYKEYYKFTFSQVTDLIPVTEIYL